MTFPQSHLILHKVSVVVVQELKCLWIAYNETMNNKKKKNYAICGITVHIKL